MKTARGAGILTGIILTGAAGIVLAETHIWVGGGTDRYWSEAANWEGGVLPDFAAGTADILFASNSTYASGAILRLDSDVVLNSLTIQSKDFVESERYSMKILSGRITRLADPAGDLPDQTIDSGIILGADGVIDTGRTGKLYMTKPISDEGKGFGLTKQGKQPLYFANSIAPVAHTYSGPTFVKEGQIWLRTAMQLTGSGNVRIGGPTGADARLYSGEHTFPVGDDGVTTFGRLGNTASVRLDGGGRLHLYGASSADTTERVGGIAIGAGSSILSCLTYSGYSLTLEAEYLARVSAADGDRGILHLSSLFDASTGFFKLDSTAGLTQLGGDGSRVTNKKIVPYLFSTTPGSTWYTLLRYDSAKGFTPLDRTADFVSTTNLYFPAVHPDGFDNVYLSQTNAAQSTTANATSVTLTNHATVNSLLLDAASATTATAKNFYLDLAEGKTLTVKSGVVGAMQEGSTAINELIRIRYGTVDFGDAEGVIFNTVYGALSRFEIQSALRGTNGLTIHNGSTGGFSSQTESPALSGPITLNGGIAYCGAATAFGIGNPMRLRAGAEYQILTYDVVHSGLWGHGSISFQRETRSATLGSGVPVHTRGLRLVDGGTLSPGVIPAALGQMLPIGALTVRNVNTDTLQNLDVALEGGDLVIDLANSSEYDQLIIAQNSGYASLLKLGDSGAGVAGATLMVRLDYLPGPDDLFTIVRVEGETPIAGRFSNGRKVMAAFDNQGVWFDILYNSDLGDGDGNDIVLRRSPPPAGTLVILR